MNAFEFDSELRRLAALAGKPWDGAEGQRRKVYRDELFRIFGRVSLERWRTAIDFIVERREKSTLPLPAEFRRALDSTAAHVEQSGRPMTSEEHGAWLLKEGGRLGPLGAARALEFSEEFKILLPEEVIRILAAKAVLQIETPSHTPGVGGARPPTGLGADVSLPTPAPVRGASEVAL